MESCLRIDLQEIAERQFASLLSTIEQNKNQGYYSFQFYEPLYLNNKRKLKELGYKVIEAKYSKGVYISW